MWPRGPRERTQGAPIFPLKIPEYHLVLLFIFHFFKLYIAIFILIPVHFSIFHFLYSFSSRSFF
nr:MAG TPA: hypothetical protein [Caudoviricetes sp.]